MRRIRTLFAAVLSIACLGLICTTPVAVLCSTGCATGAQTPLQSYSLANDAFINAQARVATLRQAGRINTEDFNKVVLPLMRETDALLTEWDAALKAGTPTQINYAALLKTALARVTAACSP